jgi:hypothetical protein
LPTLEIIEPGVEALGPGGDPALAESDHRQSVWLGLVFCLSGSHAEVSPDRLVTDEQFPARSRPGAVFRL